MIRYLIATHGTLANGYVSSVKVLTGIDWIDSICAYSDDCDINKLFEDKLSKYSKDDIIIVFTDIFGGSVTQVAANHFKNLKVYLIAGFNLPLLLEILLYKGTISEGAIQNMIEESKNQIILANTYVSSN